MKFLFGALLVLASPVIWAAESAYDFKVKSIDEKPVDLATFKGKTALIVNVASKCGYTPQYAGLEALYKKYEKRGFVVLGFPSNNFFHQEPGNNQEIKHFCQAKYNVDFPLFAKADVKGKDIQPLYAYLVQNAPVQPGTDVGWNFEKFLINPQGKIVGRFKSNVKPDDKELVEAIERNLPAKS